MKGLHGTFVTMSAISATWVVVFTVTFQIQSHVGLRESYVVPAAMWTAIGIITALLAIATKPLAADGEETTKESR